MVNMQRAYALLDNLGDRVVRYGSKPRVAIEEVERILKLHLPESYKDFVSRYGAIRFDRVTIFGITDELDRFPSLVWALARLWTSSPAVPRNLVPIHLAEDTGLFTCLECQTSVASFEDASVVVWDPHSLTLQQNPRLVSPDFSTYLFESLMHVHSREIGLKTMEGHVRQFEEDYLKAGRVPRNHVWRPFRFCTQDVVLGLTVVRHSIDNNCLEVDVCMTSDVPEYELNSGAKVMASFLLSEGYKCGGSMEIRFTENVERGNVPRALCDLADTYGVTLEHVVEGRITPSEARQLYVAITEFSPALQDHIEALARAGKLSQERASYAVHHGLWTRAELENIILGSSRADSILGGDALPEQRHLYLNDLLHARAAVMGGFLDRKLAKRERGDANEALDLEDDVRPLEISFDATYYAKVYSCSEDVPIPWSRDQSQGLIKLPAESQLIALLRARDVEDLALRFEQDLDLAGRLATSLGSQATHGLVCILVPRDYEELPQDFRERFTNTAQNHGVHIMICPETTVSLDADAVRRLASSRIMRE